MKKTPCLLTKQDTHKAQEIKKKLNFPPHPPPNSASCEDAKMAAAPFVSGLGRIHTAAQAKRRQEPVGLRALVCFSQQAKLVGFRVLSFAGSVFPWLPTGRAPWTAKIKQTKTVHGKKKTKKKQLKDLRWSPGEKVGKEKNQLLA